MPCSPTCTGKMMYIFMTNVDQFRSNYRPVHHHHQCRTLTQGRISYQERGRSTCTKAREDLFCVCIPQSHSSSSAPGMIPSLNAPHNQRTAICAKGKEKKKRRRRGATKAVGVLGSRLLTFSSGSQGARKKDREEEENTGRYH